MALNYLSGRVSRIAAGIPGVSTAGDLTVAISGALGIETFKPRADADVPNISIRGNLVDAAQETGGIGYYLSQDADGVKWVETPPIISNAIFVFDNDRIVGLGSFTGLNFFTGDDDELVQVTEDPSNPNIAKITFDNRWVRTDYGSNKSLSTSFGPNGTFWSLPGYGTSEATGITSIGIGTNQPQADLQVGIGSTGVQIFGEEGLLQAEKIEAKDIAVDGNLEVRSLVVRPGIATLAFLEVENDAKIPLEYVGVSSIREARVTQLFAEQIQAGLTTLGFGGQDVFILDDLFVQGGIGTFDNDVFVGGDLTVAGKVFFKYLEVENAVITGIVTGNVGLFTDFQTDSLIVSGLGTIGQIGFNTGIGTALRVEELDVTNVANIETANVGFASIRSEVVDYSIVGFSSVGISSIGIASITEAGIGTANIGFATVSGPLYVGGASTLAGEGGITTTGGDFYVGNDLFVAGDTTFGQIFAKNIFVSGITTTKRLEFAVGVGTTAIIEKSTTGIATIGYAGITTASILGLGATFANVSGVATISKALVSEGTIGILDGNQLQYGIGTISNLYAGIITGNNLAYSGISTIGPATFTSDLVSIGASLSQLGRVEVGVSKTISPAGIVTTRGDMYVGEDLYVGGDTTFNQIFADNLKVSGITTTNELDFNVGIGTSLRLETAQVTGIATIRNLVGAAVSYIEAEFIDLKVYNRSDLNLVYINSGITTTQVTTDLTVTDADITREQVGTSNVEKSFVQTGVTTDLTVTTERVGTSTITRLDNGYQTSGISSIGIATVGNLRVTGITTFDGVVDINKVEFVELSVTGVATIGELYVDSGIATDFVIDTERVGVSSIGLASITKAEVTDLESYNNKFGYVDIGVGFGTNRGSFNRTGVGTIVGFTTITGDVFIDGNLTVTGIASYDQLNSKKSQIGILTVFENLDAGNAISSFKDATVNRNLEVIGISTIGLTTIANGDININRNLTVGGITTFQGVVNIEETSFVNQEVTGISSINLLKFNAGFGTALTQERLDAGITTSVFLDVTDTANIQTGIVSDLTVGVSTVGLSSVGILTAVYLDTQYINAGVGTIGNIEVFPDGSTEIGDLVVTGVATFKENVFTEKTIFGNNAEIETVGINTLRWQLGVGTYSQLGVASVGLASITEAQVTTANVYRENVAISSVGFATIGYGNTEAGSFYRVGVGTIVGLTTFVGNVFIDGNLSVTGISSVEDIGADRALIGILTVFNYIDNRGDLFTKTLESEENTRITGLTTITGITSITGNTSAFGTLSVDGNTTVTGVATVVDVTFNSGNIAVPGIATVGGNAFLGNDLDVARDLTIGRNAVVPGIATVGTIKATFGEVDSLFATDFEASTATIGFATITQSVTDIAAIDQAFINSEVVGISTVTNAFISALQVSGNSVMQGNLRVDGVSNLAELRASSGWADLQFANLGISTIRSAIVTRLFADDVVISGITTAEGDVFIEGNTRIDKNLVIGEGVSVGTTVQTTDLTVSGIATIEQLQVNTGVVTSLTVAEGDVDRLAAGYGRVGFLTVGDPAGFAPGGISTTAPTFYRTGIGTIVGFTTITGDVFIDGNLDVLGFTSFTKIRAEEAILGIVTVQDYLDVEGPLDVIGDSTLTNVYATGIVSALNLQINQSGQIDGTLEVNDNANFTGAANTFTGKVEIREQLTVGNDTDITGILTVRGAGIISATSNVTTPDLRVTSTGFIQNLTAINGNITTLNGTDLSYATGDIGNLTATDTETLRLNVTQQALAQNLTVTGLSTFIGLSTFQGDVYGKDIYLEGTYRGTNLIVTNNVQGVNATFENGGIDRITSSEIDTDYLRVVGLATIANAEIGNVDVGVGTIGQANLTNLSVSGVTTTENLVVNDDSSLFNLTVNDFLTVKGNTILEQPVRMDSDLTVFGSSIFQEVDARNLRIAGVATVLGPFEAGSIINNGTLDQVGLSTFRSTIDVVTGNLNIVTGDLFATSGIITTLSGENLTYDVILAQESLTSNKDITAFRNARIVGVLTATDLRVTNDALVGNVYATGIVSATTGEFADLTVTNSLTTKDFEFTGVGLGSELNLDKVTADVGEITVLSGFGITFTEGKFISQVETLGLIVAGLSSLNTVTAETITATDVAVVNNLNFNVGTGTALTAEDINFDNLEGDFAQIGIVTATSKVETPLADVGIVTATTVNAVQVNASGSIKLDNTFEILEFETTASGPNDQLFLLDSGTYASFDVTVTAFSGSDIMSTKIHGLCTDANPTNVLHNEYSTVSTGAEFVTYDVLASNQFFALQASNSAGSVTYRVRAELTLRP